MAIGIGLDHGENSLAGAGEMLSLEVVVFKRFKIDFYTGGTVSPGITHDDFIPEFYKQPATRDRKIISGLRQKHGTPLRMGRMRNRQPPREVMIEQKCVPKI
jgi:hypothetical protein